MDPLAEKYFGQSPFNYVHNNSINSIDPDGRLVIFVNGQHGGTGGSVKYWEGFDSRVKTYLHDSNAWYYDGAIGGWGSTLGAGIFTGLGNNLSSENRYQAGYDKGYEDAAYLIESLSRDENGNINETIKIITHSMGGVFGNGMQNGILKYLREHPELRKQVKINLVAHFDPFQADEMWADRNIFTQQFIHIDKKGRKDSDGLGFLANLDVEGVDELFESQTEAAHGIKFFFTDINNLQEGTYKWDGKNWECTNCN